MKFLIDENLSPDWAKLLIAHGLESAHWSNLGSGDAPDSEIIDFAAAQGWTVLTQDLDFGIALATARLAAPSVIQLRTNDVNPAVIGKPVIEIILQMKVELTTGVLLTIDTNSSRRVRVTLLPIPPRR
jgi:predicted nuclease of predicted toxin-antitoxin system